MSSGNNIVIKEPGTFPAKIGALLDAIQILRKAAGDFTQITDSAKKEAASFTRDSTPAPVYAPLLEALGDWEKAIKAATEAVCTSADNSAVTLDYKTTGIVHTVEEARDRINKLSAH